ncbi:MAG: hypothetical protein HYU98_00475, partial [Deltaproteobacteria bacterium]|nr:hypothetical protein [Deltaproteobacteria bacterium]
MAEFSINFQILDNLPDELVKASLITPEQLAVARVTQKNMGGDIGRILIKKGFVSETQILKFIADKLRIPFISLASRKIDSSVVKFVPINLAQKYHFVPVGKEKDVLTIAMADPLDLFALDEIKGVVKCDCEPAFTTPEEVEKAIKLHYHMQDPFAGMEESIEVVDYGWGGETEGSEKLEELASGSKIVSIVNGIIAKAYHEHASDIHIEPQLDSVRVRYRIDGLLEERIVLSKKM